LTPVSNCHESRTAVEGRTEVVLAAQLDLTGVKRHPDSDLPQLTPLFCLKTPLRVERRTDGVERVAESCVDGVTDGLEDNAVLSCDGRTKQSVVAEQCRGIGLWVLT
jgi:hypothetical protein